MDYKYIIIYVGSYYTKFNIIHQYLIDTLEYLKYIPGF